MHPMRILVQCRLITVEAAPTTLSTSVEQLEDSLESLDGTQMLVESLCRRMDVPSLRDRAHHSGPVRSLG